MAFPDALAPTFTAVAILMLLTVAVLRGSRTPSYLAPALAIFAAQHSWGSSVLV